MEKFFNIKDIIYKKANGKSLSKEEVDFAVNGYVSGDIADYQMSALLMAIYTKGMTNQETYFLTNAMLHSGEILDLSEFKSTVDKHSTGGVSDTTTLIITPICACLGVNMLKLSGRGLGHTGGTTDKLEAFTGYQVELPLDKAKLLVKKNGGCMLTTSFSLAPADKKIYALRDTTSTVESLPLIASSIMSKKLACGADSIVLDVKYGNGAFMKTKKDAKKLGNLMCKIGTLAGKKMFVYIDDMNQPLGYNVGQTLESFEAIEILKGKKGNLYEKSVDLATLCAVAGLGISKAEARKKVIDCISSGKALEKLKTMIHDQGGDLSLFNKLPMKKTMTIFANSSGKIKAFKTQKLGNLVGEMGSIRQKLSDKIEYNVGIKTFHKIGDKVKKGDAIIEIYAKNKNQAQKFSEEFRDCIIIK